MDNELIANIKNFINNFYVPAKLVEYIENLIKAHEKDSLYIECLHSGGVDNWEWYSESLKKYFEKYPY